MFGLGMPEILLILAIALIVIGPKKLPDLAKTLGRAMGEFKNAAQDFKRSIDLDKTIRDIKEPAEEFKKDIEDTIKNSVDDDSSFDDPPEKKDLSDNSEKTEPKKKQKMHADKEKAASTEKNGE
ncbi:MAG: twin-arginine translocase TatA/TatE family subunit [Thermodesulfobacteriota bacterium]|nr:twin-arginine translocase TatA/TatE family subunit [Thermodesulfobacteriota bacterium]